MNNNYKPNQSNSRNSSSLYSSHPKLKSSSTPPPPPPFVLPDDNPKKQRPGKREQANSFYLFIYFFFGGGGASLYVNIILTQSICNHRMLGDQVTWSLLEHCRGTKKREWPWSQQKATPELNWLWCPAVLGWIWQNKNKQSYIYTFEQITEKKSTDKLQSTSEIPIYTYISHQTAILVQYSDKFMHSIVLYSIVLRRSQLYCIVNLLLCGYNTIQWCA